MKHTNFRISIKLIATALIISGISCVESNHVDSPSGYDLNLPEKFNMPQNLFEISGIAFNNGDIKQAFAIQDEEGDLFHFALGDKDVSSTKFGSKGDYEDLAIYKNKVVVLKSNGELHIFSISELRKAVTENVIKVKDIVPKGEYEGLSTDNKTGLIYILTKESKADQKNKATSLYAFRLKDDSSLTPNGKFDLPFKEIEKLSGEKKIKFRPSALAKNQSTNEWYILSSVNKLLIITDSNFKIKSAYPLKGNYFYQPEGIAFDKNNNLYISNEGGASAAGNVLQFKYKKP